LHDVYHLDLTSGELTKTVDNPGFLGWVIDNDNKVRGAVAPQPDGGMQVVVRDSESSDWRPLITFASDDALSSGPVGFTADGTGMYTLSAVDANAARLVTLDVATGDVLDVLAEDPTFDLVSVEINPDTREPQLAGFLKEQMEWVVLDPSIAEDIEAIKKIQDGDFIPTDRDHADNTWLIAFDVDDGPIRYYAFDRSTKQATFLFNHRPDLEKYTLAPMEPFSFKARDGLEVNGYLSFPPGLERQNLPTVINVHGGPWARDTWGFNPEAQWLANRGYLCIQINFRGSTGYGKEFTNAGDKQWGGTMQDDVTDAVKWAIDQGLADPARVAIYGGSYGGYATLAGEDFLWSRSPLSKVDEIRAPMLIAHGANDPRVKLAETEQIVAAMTEKSIDHELMVFDDEGHGFAKPENRLKFYRAADAFLAKHIGGRSE
jgi:dipeptidyl aminopeptidase/acylaminoacyl peptidase